MAKSKNSRGFQRKFTNQKAQSLWDELDGKATVDLKELVQSVGKAVATKHESNVKLGKVAEAKRDKAIKELVDAEAQQVKNLQQEAILLEQEAKAALDAELQFKEELKRQEAEFKESERVRLAQEKEAKRRQDSANKITKKEAKKVTNQKIAITPSKLNFDYQRLVDDIAYGFRNIDSVNEKYLIGLKDAHKKLYADSAKLYKGDADRVKLVAFKTKLDLKKRWVNRLVSLSNKSEKTSNVDESSLDSSQKQSIKKLSRYEKKWSKYADRDKLSKRAFRKTVATGQVDEEEEEKREDTTKQDEKEEKRIERAKNKYKRSYAFFKKNTRIGRGLGKAGQAFPAVALVTNMLQGSVYVAAKTIKGVASLATGTLKAVKVAAWDAPKWLFKRIEGLTRSMFRFLRRPFDMVRGSGSFLGSLIGLAALAPLIKSLAEGVFEEISKTDTYQQISEFLKTFWADPWKFVGDKVKEWLRIDEMKEYLTQKWEDASALVTKVWSDVNGYAIEKWNAASAYAIDKWNSATQGITAFVERVLKFFGYSDEKIKEFREGVTQNHAAVASQDQSIAAKTEEIAKARVAHEVAVTGGNPDEILKAKVALAKVTEGTEKTNLVRNITGIIKDEREGKVPEELAFDLKELRIPFSSVVKNTQVSSQVGGRSTLISQTDVAQSNVSTPPAPVSSGIKHQLILKQGSESSMSFPLGSVSSSAPPSPSVSTTSAVSAPMDRHLVVAPNPAEMAPQNSNNPGIGRQGRASPNGTSVAMIPNNAVRDGLIYYNSVGFG